MPLPTSVVGHTTAALEHSVDARWIMAYAAALGDLNPRMLDTAGHAPVQAHPVFPVCVEWPVILDTRHIAGMTNTEDARGLTRAESARGVHAAHDLHIVRPVRDGDRLSTVADFVSAKAVAPGAAYVLRLSTRDAAGDVVCTTWQTGIYRGVAIDGEPRSSVAAPPLPDDTGMSPTNERLTVHVPANLAHTYTECARIWNPIHSDRAVALAAGLPDIILHGTATLALAVSAIANHCIDGALGRITRLGGRFSAMVPLPDTLTVEITGRGADGVRYQVRNGAGQLAITAGFVCWG